MSEITRTFILTGCRAGATCELRKMQFVEGKCTVTAPDKDMASLAVYMGRTYKAFFAGTPELEYFQAEDANGASNVDAEHGSAHQVATVPGGVQSAGAGPAQEAPDAGTRNAGAGNSGAGGESNGNGNGSDPGGKQALQQVILQLDPKDDELWTADGRPRVDAVATASGREDMNRGAVEAAAPGYLRPTAE